MRNAWVGVVLAALFVLMVITSAWARKAEWTAEHGPRTRRAVKRRATGQARQAS